jgi:thiol:disulfide interchange protein
MKRILLLFFIPLLFSACSIKADYPWFKGNLDEAKATAGDKLILLDFYAVW